jgi:peptidoglycan hydrolase-like protein with peptidoglycan-binding domain
MTDFKGFKGAAKRLDDIDIPRIGATIGVGEDEIHAFMDVEAAGAGFDSQGRPKMLFEPHVFYRNLSGTKRSTAVRLGLAYPTWKRNYPADSYPRLIKAMAIDETAALKAASWGLGQVLGENYAMIGYLSPQEMVFDFMADEEAHLKAIVAFLIKSGIADDLKAHRWSTVARVYNGAGYRANDYDGKMARAFAKWQKIKDTPWQPGDPPVVVETPDEAMPVLRKGDGWTKNLKLRPYVAKAQNRLMVHGFDPGAFDGKFGDATLEAVIAFQKARGFEPDGVIGGYQTWPALLAEPKALTLVSGYPPEQPQPVAATKTEAVLIEALGEGAALVSARPSPAIRDPQTADNDEGSWWPEIIACTIVGSMMLAAIYFILR